MERPRGVNLTNSGGGDPLCTLHRAEALYGKVRYKVLMRDSRLKSKSDRHQPHRWEGKERAPLRTL